MKNLREDLLLELYGGSLKDTSGNGNDAVIQGTVTLVPDLEGRKNKAFSFTGITGDYLLLPIDLGAGLSECTMLQELWTTSTDVQALTLVFGGFWGIYFPKDTAGKVLAFFDGSTGGDPESGSGYNDGKRHIVVATNDGSTTKIYVDGVLLASRSETLVEPPEGNASSIGSNITGIQAYKGTIGKTQVWSRAFNADEVWQATSDIKSNYQGLMDGAVLDMDMRGDALDSSGQGNDGTVTGATLATDRFGIPNNAYDFESNNSNYITLSSNTDLNFGANDFTISVITKKESDGDNNNDLISNHDGSHGWTIERSGPGIFTYRFFWHESGGFQISPFFTIDTGLWNHIIITGDTDVKVYKNGVLLSTDTRTGAITDFTTSLPLIGGQPASPTQHSYDGIVSDVKILNGKSLSAGEVQAFTDLMSKKDIHTYIRSGANAN